MKTLIKPKQKTYINGHLCETPKEAGYRFIGFNMGYGKGSIVLYNLETNKLELWHHSEHFAGYTIRVNGKHYEFIRDIELDVAYLKK